MRLLTLVNTFIFEDTVSFSKVQIISPFSRFLFWVIPLDTKSGNSLPGECLYFWNSIIHRLTYRNWKPCSTWEHLSLNYKQSKFLHTFCHKNKEVIELFLKLCCSGCCRRCWTVPRIAKENWLGIANVNWQENVYVFYIWLSICELIGIVNLVEVNSI